LRLFFYASIFQDSVYSNSANFNLAPPSLLQQKINPKLIIGRVNITDYLEEGAEVTLQPLVANFVGSGPQYLAIETDFKKVFIVGERNRDNIACYLSLSSMGNGGPNYLYNVGGYHNVRGYSDMREFGRRMAFANVEYRPYLFSHRFELLNLDLMTIQGSLFSDVGSAWGDSALTGESAADAFRPLWSGGVGLRIKMVRFAAALLRLDFAQTISPAEGFGISFGIGQFF
jgi:outer membrane protein assembly factor BamA